MTEPGLTPIEIALRDVLPIDWDDATCVVEVVGPFGDGGEDGKRVIWGDWRRLASSIVDAVEPLIRAQVAEDETDAVAWKQDFGALSAAVNDLYQIHAPRQIPTAPEGYTVCDTCVHGPPPARHVRWPCPTVERLDEACVELTRRAIAREHAKENTDATE